MTILHQSQHIKRIGKNTNHILLTVLFPIIQYKEWCNSGIAFEFGDQSYTEPNRSMMSYAEGTLHYFCYSLIF